MTDKTNWKASLIEHRTAWITACFCLLIVLIAGTKPELFKITSKQAVEPTTHGTPATEQVTASTPEKVEKPAVAAKKPVVKRVKAKPTSPAPGYYVQLGAFGEASRAQGLLEMLKKQNWKATTTRKADGLLAVWAGPKKSRTDAEKLQKAIEKKLKIKSFIVLQQRK